MIFDKRIGYFRNRDKNCPYMKWHISYILGVDRIGRPRTQDIGIYFQCEDLAKEYCDRCNREYEEEMKRTRECVESAAKWLIENQNTFENGSCFANLASYCQGWTLNILSEKDKEDER